MTKSFGLTTYDDYEFKKPNTGNKSGGGDEWMRLKEGPNELRLVTDPYVYMVHKYKEEGDRGFGDKVNCSIYHGSCPLCEHEDEKIKVAKPRWFVGVIDRKDQRYKVLDMSPGVFQDLQKYSRKERWGDPTGYEIDIQVDKTGGPSGYYTVMPLGKDPLSEADIEIKQGIDLESFVRRCTPPTPEKVLERIQRIRDRKNGVNTPRPSAVETRVPVTPADHGTVEKQYDFTQHQQQS